MTNLGLYVTKFVSHMDMFWRLSTILIAWELTRGRNKTFWLLIVIVLF